MSTVLSHKELVETLCRLAAEQAGVTPAEVNLNSDFIHDLSYDSLDKVEFVMQLEDELDIEVADQEAESVKTVGDAVQMVERLLSRR